MQSTTTEQAVRAQTATGVPPNNESLSQGDIQDGFLQAPRQRTRIGSTSSLESNVSLRSAFSNETASRNDAVRKQRVAINEKRAKQWELIPIIKDQLQKMLQVCDTQKNISMTIKLGLKEVDKLVGQMKAIHQEVDKLEEVYATHLEWNEEARADRRIIRERVQARMIRDTVLSCNQKRDRDQKRGRSQPGDSPESESQQSKKAKKQKKKVDVVPQIVTRSDDNQRRKLTPKVLIKVGQGHSYASILGKIREEVNPDASNTKVLSMRKTQKGDLLLSLGKDSDKVAFVGALQSVIHEAAVVSPEGPKCTVEICDLDALTEVREVEEALQKALQSHEERRKVLLLRENSVGQKMALVTTDKEEAYRLLEMGRIRIGFMSCRIRKRVTVLRCFRCQEFGHTSRDCTGADRSHLCFKCGGADHKKAECQNEAHCFLCENDGLAERNHFAGSGSCKVFRKILEKEKKKARMKS